MLEIIKKDLKLLLRKRPSFIIPFLPLLSILIFRGGEIKWATLELIFLILTIESLMSFDFLENKDSQGLILSLPVRNKDLVLSKYLPVPFIIIINIGLTLIYLGLLSFMGVRINYLISLRELLGVSFVAVTILSFSIPWYFVISRRVASFISYLLIFFTFNRISVIGNYTKDFSSSFYRAYGGLLPIVFGLFLLYLSCLFSIIVFKNTDI